MTTASPVGAGMIISPGVPLPAGNYCTSPLWSASHVAAHSAVYDDQAPGGIAGQRMLAPASWVRARGLRPRFHRRNWGFLRVSTASRVRGSTTRRGRAALG